MLKISCIWINFPYSNAEHTVIWAVSSLTKFMNYCGLAKGNFIKEFLSVGKNFFGHLNDGVSYVW